MKGVQVFLHDLIPKYHKKWKDIFLFYYNMSVCQVSSDFQFLPQVEHHHGAPAKSASFSGSPAHQTPVWVF